MPEDTIHSYSVSFLVRREGQGSVAVINPGAHEAAIQLAGGKITYHSVSGSNLEIDTTTENKGWQYIVVTHQHASGKNTLYANGKEAGTLSEFIDFREYILGGPGKGPSSPSPEEAGYKDLLIYRSAHIAVAVNIPET